MFVLDTNTLIYFFKGQGKVSERLLATSPQLIAVSTITLFELETGLLKSNSNAVRRQQIDALVNAVKVLPVNQTVAEVSAKIRFELEAKGLPIGPLDTLIAGTALSAKASIVTRNVREFARVTGLTVVDWFE